MEAIDQIKKYMDDNPGPWCISMYTMPLTGELPHEFTAGFMSAVIDDVECPNEGIISFTKGGEDKSCHVFVADAIDMYGTTIEGGLCFLYHNLKVMAEGFAEHPIVVICPVNDLE